MSSESRLPTITFNKAHALELYYFLKKPVQPTPQDWLPEDLDAEGNPPDTYTILDLINLSTDSDSITKILDIIAQELGNVAHVAAIQTYSEVLEEGVEYATTPEELEIQYQLADMIADLLSRGTVQAQVLFEYINMVVTHELLSRRAKGPGLLTAQGRRWIHEARKSGQLIEEGLAIQLPPAMERVRRALEALDQKSHFHVNRGHHKLLVEAGIVSQEETELSPSFLVERSTTPEQVVASIYVLFQELSNLATPVLLLDFEIEELEVDLENASSLEDLEKARQSLQSIETTLHRGSFDANMIQQTVEKLRVVSQSQPRGSLRDLAWQHIRDVRRIHARVSEYLTNHQAHFRQAVLRLREKIDAKGQELGDV